jgi:hypothetical protein
MPAHTSATANEIAARPALVCQWLMLVIPITNQEQVGKARSCSTRERSALGALARRNHEFQPRPNVVDRTDLDIDETEL